MLNRLFALALAAIALLAGFGLVLLAWHLGHLFLWYLRHQLKWDLIMILAAVGLLMLGWSCWRYAERSFRKALGQDDAKP